MIQIAPLEPHQVIEAKRLILSVARNIYQWPEPLEDIIIRFETNRKLSDIDDFQSEYFGSQGIFLVAQEHGKLIGTGAIRKIDENTAELKRFWLLDDYQGQGIGYCLFRRLVQFTIDAGYQRICLQTDVRSVRAIHFYQQAGFHFIDCTTEDPDDVCMVMTL